jgi:hypothetical protein
MVVKVARMTLRHRFLTLAVLALVARAAPSGATVTTFFDGDFAPANWTLVEVDTNQGGSVSTEVVADGNPGNALRVTVVINPASEYSAIAGVFFWHVPYDPAVSGAIGAFDYSETARRYQATGEGQAIGLALRQNGNVFTHKVGFAPDSLWTVVAKQPIVAADFSVIVGSGALDLSSTGAPIEVGFFRANSHPPTGGGQGTQIVDLDNWQVRVLPPCSGDGDCDDGDACTTDTCDAGACRLVAVDCEDGDLCTADTCTAGTCQHPPVNCDDGRDCTADTCVSGSCFNGPFADLDLVLQEIDEVLAILEGPACGDEQVKGSIVRKLTKRLKKVRKRIVKADKADIAKVAAHVTKAAVMLTAAQVYLGDLITNGQVSQACGFALQTFVYELQVCVQGVPVQ